MKFKIYDDLQDPFYERYIKFLLNNSNTLFYQSPKFHSLLIEHLDAEINYFIWEDDDKILAAIPFLIKKSEKFGNVANSLPYYGSNVSFEFIKPQFVEKQLTEHIEGKANHRLLIWSLMNVELWCKEFLV